MKLSRGVRTAQGFLIVSGVFLIIISILAAMFRAPIKDFFELIVGGILCLCIAHYSGRVCQDTDRTIFKLDPAPFCREFFP